MIVELQVVGANASFLGYKVRQDGMDFILWCEWVNGTDPRQLSRLQMYRNLGIMAFRVNMADLAGIGLIGPIPTGDGLHNWTGAEFGNVLT